MAENSGIEWCDHTFNPWWGCQKVSPGCDNCYAETLDKRFGGGHWGHGADRRRTGQENWNKVRVWNSKAEKKGTRPRVFCASMADVFDNAVPKSWREDLWNLIRETPNLDWMLLTKRIGNVAGMLPADWPDAFSHVGLMITVVNQEEADRDIPKLMGIQAAWRGLSCEPLLGQIDLNGIAIGVDGYTADGDGPYVMDIDWVIVGGESGHHARPMHPDWARSLRDQCQAAGIPFLFKQWGEWKPVPDDELPDRFGEECLPFRVMCSNGFVGGVSIESAFLHRPRNYPQCFPNGEEGDASCLQQIVKSVGKKTAGRLLDGHEWNGLPTDRSGTCGNQ